MNINVKKLKPTGGCCCKQNLLIILKAFKKFKKYRKKLYIFKNFKNIMNIYTIINLYSMIIFTFSAQLQRRRIS